MKRFAGNDAQVTRISRRTFMAAMAAAPLARRQVPTQATPAWVPAGRPAFYEDGTGLIVHVKPDDIKTKPDPKDWRFDAGDTAQREGFTWFAISLLQQRGIQPVASPTTPWLDAIKLLETDKPGEFRRHPTDPDWNKPGDFSRDQQTPIVAALGALGPNTTLQRLWSAFDGRGRVCQNNEAGGPDHQNLFMRARRVDQLEAFGEFSLATMVWIISASGANDLDDTDRDLNFCVNIAAANEWQTTKASAAAMCEYIRLRPVNYGCFLEKYRRRHADLEGVDPNVMMDRIRLIMEEDPRIECHPSIGALRWYFRFEAGAPWGPAAVWEQVITNVFLPTCRLV
jgi:hypothetical protein